MALGRREGTTLTAAPSATRWAGVGHSTEPDPARAGADAAGQAVGDRDPNLVIVFCAISYDLEPLVAAINDRCGGAPLIGCTTAGEIAADGPGDGGVVVTALGGDGFDVRTAAARGASERLRAVGSDVALGAIDLDGGQHRVMMLLTDGVAGDQKEITRGVHGVVGSGLPLVGGCAGDGLEMKQTFQLHGDEVITDGVVAAAIASDAPIGLGWSHGWERVGEPMLVTRSDNNRVYEIDDKPALDTYLRRLEAPDEARNDAAEFTKWARLRPLGLGQRRSGQEPVRCVNDANFEDRSIGCTAEVPQGGMAWFMRGDADSILRSTVSACDAAAAALDGEPPRAVITFDCIGRRGVLGEDGIGLEVERITQSFPGVPVSGFYTYGEIARTRGVNAVHSQTVVALAFG
jgi:hypothetical protein